jgi:hypothetical protein
VQQNKVGEQKLYKRLGHSSLLLVLVLTALISQLRAESFADFRRDQSSGFKNYKEENDRIFTSYLKSDWEAYYLKDPLSTYKEKKPREIYPARNIVVKKQGPRVNIEVEKKKAHLETVIPVVAKKDINFDFFGTKIALNIPQGMEKAKFYPQSKEGVSAYFDTVVLSPYESLIKNIKNISYDLNLNDWGKYMLITKLSDAIFVNQDESRLLSWFIFNKLGYAVRVGLANRHVVVMHYSEKTIYATPNYNIAKKKFYIVSNYTKGNAGKVFTYKQNYPEADKPLDLSMKSLPKFVQKRMEKTLHFMQYGERYDIKYTYNQNLIDFMATYPQADYETFFNAPLDNSSYREIAAELKKYINAKQASVTLNFVLNFVQNAFKYEVDSQQFGREKVMFAQETLYYDKSDCEDRAILFSYLVKELFHIDVVGVKYKDHMATALYIPIKGDGVKIYNKKYIIADPTYVNASIGQSMPKYRKIKPNSFIFVKRKKEKE